MSYRNSTRTWTGALSAAGLMLVLAAMPAAAQSSASSSSAAKHEDKAADRSAGERITDAWILTKVKSQFVGEDALEHSDINVDVRDHVVILKGTVASAAGKLRAAEIARKTEGVARVDNRLTVGMASDDMKEASEDAKESAREMKQDAKASAQESKREAQESARETKQEAKESAREAKEEAKETSREARDEAKEHAHGARTATGTAGAAVTDSWITTKVKSSFVGVDALEGSDIDVDTNNHVVTLRGTVPSELAKNRAVSIAKKIDGVKSVTSELTIAPKK